MGRVDDREFVPFDSICHCRFTKSSIGNWEVPVPAVWVERFSAIILLDSNHVQDTKGLDQDDQARSAAQHAQGTGRAYNLELGSYEHTQKL